MINVFKINPTELSNGNCQRIKEMTRVKKPIQSNYAGFTSGLTELCNTSQPQA
jgi:hypothetical protein